MDDKKPISEAKKRADAKWHNKAYDDIKIRVKKGQREYLRAEAEQRGLSLNAFILQAVQEKIEREQSSTKT